MAVATGAIVAAATLISMPPLPMTLASGVPPGIFFLFNYYKMFCIETLASSARVYLWSANYFEKSQVL